MGREMTGLTVTAHPRGDHAAERERGVDARAAARRNRPAPGSRRCPTRPRGMAAHRPPPLLATGGSPRTSTPQPPTADPERDDWRGLHHRHRPRVGAATNSARRSAPAAILGQVCQPARTVNRHSPPTRPRSSPRSASRVGGGPRNALPLDRARPPNLVTGAPGLVVLHDEGSKPYPTTLCAGWPGCPTKALSFPPSCARWPSGPGCSPTLVADVPPPGHAFGCPHSSGCSSTAPGSTPSPPTVRVRPWSSNPPPHTDLAPLIVQANRANAARTGEHRSAAARPADCRDRPMALALHRPQHAKRSSPSSASAAAPS